MISCQSLLGLEAKSVAISRGSRFAALRAMVVTSAHPAALSISRYLEGAVTPTFADKSIIGFPSVFVPLLVVIITTPLAAREP